MMHKDSLTIAAIIMFLTACSASPLAVDGTATQDTLNQSGTQMAATLATAIPPTPTFTLVPEPIPTEEASPTAVTAPESGQQFIAYLREGQLLVTEVTNGVQGGTTQYTMPGQNDQVTDLVWSPSGEFVAFISAAQGDPHLFYVFAVGASSPIDLGPGSAPAWSPDSQSIAYVRGSAPDDNIWITTIETPTPQQLTFETNFAWGRPAFTPDGQALVVAGADRNFIGAQGNTTFTLESLALDGTGTRTPLPAATPVDGGRLPYDLRFSPDGTRLAFSTSMHFSACASPGAYYVSQPDGSDRQEVVSPSLKPAIAPDKERYHAGLNYAWNPTSDAMVIIGTVFDCDFNSPTMGQPVAGPQMSILDMNGSEPLIMPGTFYFLSMNRTGTLIAAAHFQDYQDLNPMIELYSAQSGQLVLSLGPGNNPQLQP
jgi:dipeptidyl aminopeptidase/acylaminoacyl peptidase